MPRSRHDVFREIDVVVFCSFLDVRKRQSTVGIGDVRDLIKPRHRERAVSVICSPKVKWSLIAQLINAFRWMSVEQ